MCHRMFSREMSKNAILCIWNRCKHISTLVVIRHYLSMRFCIPIIYDMYTEIVLLHLVLNTKIKPSKCTKKQHVDMLLKLPYLSLLWTFKFWRICLSAACWKHIDSTEYWLILAIDKTCFCGNLQNDTLMKKVYLGKQ